ncbi:MAG TPA: hypothetical protein PKN52_03330 [Trueperaceae bacterium]|nr:hypothetical protein [Trueperaceae bacterium]
MFSSIEQIHRSTLRPATGSALRRAGYFDGERAPRRDHYWANQPTTVNAVTRSWRSSSRRSR